MPVVYPPESAYAIEMDKWNKPYVFQEFPKMLYMARLHEKSGQYLVADPIGEQSLDMSTVARAAAFTASCYMKVGDADEQRKYEAAGWRTSPQLALDYAKRFQEDISTAAAEEQHRLRRMSELARREFDAADRATSEHLPTLPAPKKRGRKPKVAAEVS